MTPPGFSDPMLHFNEVLGGGGGESGGGTEMERGGGGERGWGQVVCGDLKKKNERM